MAEHVRTLQSVRKHQFFIVEQLPCRTVRDDGPAVQDDDPRTHFHHQFQIMCGHQFRRGDGVQQGLEFATAARVWFENGSPEQKRDIFFSLSGSNLILKDKKLSISAL